MTSTVVGKIIMVPRPSYIYIDHLKMLVLLKLMQLICSGKVCENSLRQLLIKCNGQLTEFYEDCERVSYINNYSCYKAWSYKINLSKKFPTGLITSHTIADHPNLGRSIGMLYFVFIICVKITLSRCYS